MNREDLINQGIPFLEYIPDSWKLIPNKYLFKYDGKKVGNEWKDYELLSLTTQGVKKKDQTSVGGKVPESYENYQTVKSGQMILCLFDLDVSAVFSGISTVDGMITSAYDVFSSTQYILNEYADYWFKYVFSNRYYKLFSKNIRFTVTNENFGMIKTPVPSIYEQHKISTLLKEKEEKINALIANEEKQIEKLKAYKQALISEVVTKGLDPNVSMKDSGVEWIGEIPENWNVIRIKNGSWLKGRIGWDGLKSTEFIEEGPYLITGTDFINGEINWSSCVHITNERFEEDMLLHVFEGDLLITKDGTVGKLAIVKNAPDKVSLNSGVMIIRNIDATKYITKWLYYILSSNQFDLWYQLSQRGNSTIKHLYQAQFYDFQYALPTIEIQEKICKKLDYDCAIIHKLIDSHLVKIEHLKQYRQSIIYEYVTGKREV